MERARVRRSPETRGGRPTLNADRIAEAMLELAGRDGFRAVSMRVLAEHLGVTVRALYNHVEDRQDVVDRAMRLYLARMPAPSLDAGDWEASLAAYCAARRTYNRRHPRVLLVSLDETVREAGVHPNRLAYAEELLAFLDALGLPADRARFVHVDLTIRLFGFALLVDARGDLGQPATDSYPVPDAWLEAHPELEVPHLRAAAAAPSWSADELFDELVRSVVESVRRLREAGSG